MKLFLLTALTMVAFAANSLLNRVAVDRFGMDPVQFAVVRVIAGAVMLLALLAWRGPVRPLGHPAARLAGALALATYMLGFSLAYLTLSAGLGALILFGGVQIALFAVAVGQGQAVPPRRAAGALVAFAGLVLLLWPGAQTPVHWGGAAAMLVAAAGWAAYTVLGQREANPLAASAGNFLLCVPLVALALLLPHSGAPGGPGVALAIVAGAVTSGLGYALWYRILPALPTTVAAVAQLSVPVIAVAAGVALLGEPLTGRLVTAGALVLGGIALSLVQRRIGSSGS